MNIKWSGEGRPPVGTVCDWKHIASEAWHQAKVNYIGCAYVIFASHSGDDEQHYYLRDISFRPVSTPAQIAAEEREKTVLAAIEATYTLGISDLSKRILIERLYDTGYLKQVQP